jgi:hypothetical protein
MIRYLNTKINGQRETLDQLDSNDFKEFKEFRKEQRRILSEYCLAGGFGEMYWSQRGCK